MGIYTTGDNIFNLSIDDSISLHFQIFSYQANLFIFNKNISLVIIYSCNDSTDFYEQRHFVILLSN